MNKKEMTKEIAVEIATKYANDIWLFGGVDKECVSEVCKVLLSELDIANKKLEEIKEYLKKERNNYYDQGIKLAETNLENLLVSASLCTCDNALSIIGGEK